MAKLAEAMAFPRRKIPNVAPETVDRLLRCVDEFASTEASNDEGGFPQRPDMRELADRLGIILKKGVAPQGLLVLSIPIFYSEREVRWAIARQAAKVAIYRVGDTCSSRDREHNCEREDVRALAESAKRDANSLDIIAAAVLMPTKDFAKWAEILDREEGALADSYAVPRSIARLRLDTFSASKELTEH